jgi:septal ring-binding cell division protein DamX
MLIKTKLIGITLCAVSLSACNSLDHTVSGDAYKPSSHRDSGIQLYPDGYDNGGAYAPDTAQTAKTSDNPAVTVPETYHVGAYQAPESFKDRDKTWINSQNSQGYTIEVANGDKPAEVASVLQKTPKNERMAEVKYKHDGKDYYKGIYGTYPSYEAAQQALSTLPEDIRQNAGIKTWGSVQSSVSE